MADPKLKLGNDIWATKQKSLLAYNDEGGNYKSIPFQVDRISGGTYVGRNGLIQYAASNEPRIDFTSNTKGALLLEPQRTNLLPESENFSTNWVKIGASVSGNISSPDGSTNAYSLIEGTATGGKIIYDTISVSAGSVTFSLFMKKGDKKYTALLLSGAVSTSMFNVDLENGTGTVATGSFDNTSIDEYADGWYRVSVTKTATSGNLNCNVYLMNGATYNDRNYTGNGTDKTYIFGAQLEAGTYSTSIIPTSSAAVTRVQDYIAKGGNEYIFNDSEGVLYAEIQALANDQTYRFISISDNSTSSNRVVISFNTVSNQIRCDLVVGGSTQSAFTTNSYDITQKNKVAIQYKLNDVKMFVNGLQVGSTDTSANVFPSGTLNQINFDNGNLGSTFYFEGFLNELKYIDQALTNAELATLTTL